VLYVQGSQPPQKGVLSAPLLGVVSSSQSARNEVRLCTLPPACALQNMHAAREFAQQWL